MRSTHESVLIIGGAIVGSAIGYFLRQQGFSGEITIIEQDPSYQWSSTVRSASAIRTQFGCSVNVLMSLFGAEFFRSIGSRFGADADIGFVERGYVILGSPSVIGERQAGVALQREAGAEIAAMTASEAKERFAWMKVDDLGIVTMGQRDEGWFDAWSLLALLRGAARARGVTYATGSVVEVVAQGARATGVRLADGTLVRADWCVVAAGAASAKVVSSLGIPLPVSPRKRTVFVIKASLDQTNFPMLFDTSGAWIRPEGEGFICGIGPKPESDPDAAGDFEPAHELFEESVWPALAHRIPALEQLRVERAWAGHYEVNTLDHNGIIGPHNEIANLLFATGFSGHGVMHAPATGRGIAELIALRRYDTTDLTPLGYGRICSGVPLHETVIY